MPTPRDIITFVENTTGHILDEDEYITFGNRQVELTGVTVAWMVTPESIMAAVDAGHNCIVHHEALTYPYPGFGGGQEREYLSWPINIRRLGLLAKHGITTIRIHFSVDEISIYNAFAEQLCLGYPIVDDKNGKFSKIFLSPVQNFGELIKHVKKSVNMPFVRTSKHDSKRQVRRIGLPWGGLGLFVNVGYVQTLIDLGVDTLICGETDNYGFRFAVESGIAVIETSHEISETKGLKKFSDQLRDELIIDVQLVDVSCIWQVA